MKTHSIKQIAIWLLHLCESIANINMMEVNKDYFEIQALVESINEKRYFYISKLTGCIHTIAPMASVKENYIKLLVCRKDYDKYTIEFV